MDCLQLQSKKPLFAAVPHQANKEWPLQMYDSDVFTSFGRPGVIVVQQPVSNAMRTPSDTLSDTLSKQLNAWSSPPPPPPEPSPAGSLAPSYPCGIHHIRWTTAGHHLRDKHPNHLTPPSINPIRTSLLRTDRSERVSPLLPMQMNRSGRR